MLAQEINTETTVESLNQLRELIYQALCDHEQLEIGVFPMTERILVRGGRPCGMHFCLHGPRSVKCTSIWETDRNTLLFYGCTGERFLKSQLVSAPSLQLDADEPAAKNA